MGGRKENELAVMWCTDGILNLMSWLAKMMPDAEKLNQNDNFEASKRLRAELIAFEKDGLSAFKKTLYNERERMQGQPKKKLKSVNTENLKHNNTNQQT